MIETNGMTVRLVQLDKAIMLELSRDINEDETVKVLTDLSDIIQSGRDALWMISEAVQAPEKPKPRSKSWDGAKARLFMRAALHSMNSGRYADADEYLEKFQREISKAPDDLYMENMRSLDAAYQSLAELKHEATKRN